MTTFTWYFSVDVGKRADGKRRRIDRGGFQTKRDAERAMRDLLSKADRGRVVEPSSLTVAEFLRDEWLPSMEMTIARTTWEGYRGNVERYIAPRIGALPLTDLQPTTINHLYADVRTNGRIRGDEPLSLKSVREVHVTLHRALEDAVRWEYLDTNPARRANAPSATAARNARKKAIQTWTAEQVLVFATMYRDHESLPLWLLAASTGMRRSELLGLRWRDIDMEGGRLAVRQSLVLVAGRPEFKDAPKSAYGFRTIRIPDHAVSELMKLCRSQLQARLESPVWHEHDLVFCRPGGLPWHPDHVTKTVRDMVADSGLPRIRPLQDLRHTHATLLLANGANPKVVQERLGHHSHSFTADTYQHTMAGMDEAVATQFGRPRARERRGHSGTPPAGAPVTLRPGDFHEAIAALQFDRFVGRVDLDASWPDLRYALYEALEAAGSGTAINPNRPIQSERQRMTARRLQLHALVDGVGNEHDPYTDWWAFRATLYEAWRQF